MRAAFICWRPYQLFNAINIICNNLDNLKGISDIYFLNLPSLIKCKESLEQTKIFNHIVIFKEKVNNSRLEYIIDIINAKKSIMRDIVQAELVNLNYDYIVTSGYHSFFVRIANLNSNAKCIFMEDGMNSYMEIEKKKYNQSILHMMLKIIFKKGIQVIKIEKTYLYHPEYAIHNKNDRLYRLPSLTPDIIQIIALIFGEIKGQGIRKVIYLTQPLENIWKEQKRELFEEKYIQKSIEKYKHLVTVRIHPRYNEYQTFLDIDDSNQMWELRVKDICRNSVLISIFSTASFTPFLLMDKCPILILLYKIALREEGTICKNADQFIKKIANTYSNSIFIPNSFEELDDILNNTLRDYNSNK